MQNNDLNRAFTVHRDTESVLATNKVLQNTYMLLGLTLMFSCVTATLATVGILPMPSGGMGILFFFVGAYGLMFLTHALSNSIWGIASVFAFTGFMGWMLGPLLSVALSFSNGPELIATALGSTGLAFFGLSAYILTTKKDMSFLRGFLVTGMIIMLVAILANLFFQSPVMALVISSCVAMLSCGLIMWQTSEIVNGGETNYIIATVGLYVQLYNLFTSLLHILLAFAGNRD